MSNPDVWPLLEQLAHSRPPPGCRRLPMTSVARREQLLNVVGVNRELLLTERLLRWEHYLQPGTVLPVSPPLSETLCFSRLHCHLDGLDYQTLHKNVDDVLAKAAARDVKFCLAVATTPRLPQYARTGGDA